VQKVAFWKLYVVSISTIGIFLYVAQGDERVLSESSLRETLCWLKSHYQHISLFRTGNWTRASSILRNHTTPSKDGNPCHPWDSNPQSTQSRGR